MTDRQCPVCGTSLEDRRPHAQTCSPRCRRELHRTLKIAAGRTDGPYQTLIDLRQRGRNRAKQTEAARQARQARRAAATNVG